MAPPIRYNYIVSEGLLHGQALGCCTARTRQANRAEPMPFVPKTKNQKPKTNLPGGRLKAIVARRKADLKGEV